MVNLEKSTFVKKYRESMINSLHLMKPNIPISKIEELVDRKIQSNPKLLNEEKNVTIRNNYENVQEDYTLLKVLDFYEKKKPIMTGYGVMFKQHKDAINLNADFVNWLMSERKVAKKQQFAASDAGDYIKESFYEMMQKTFKLLNNSYYGATGEKNSQFYNPVIPWFILWGMLKIFKCWNF